MKESQSVNNSTELQANAKTLYEVTADDLPLHCPMDGMSLWNSHPRVYIPMDSGSGQCPYCGAKFILT